MQVEIIQGPGNSAARVMLAQNERCISEGGAMIAYRGEVSVETTTQARKRKLGAGLKRMLAGESFFLNSYHARSNSAEVIFSSPLPGDMAVIDLGAVNIVAEGGSFVVRSEGVTVDMEWQGLKSVLSGEGLFWLRLGGSGKVVLSSFGAIYTVDIDGEYIVDTGHIVAFEETLNFSITKAGTSWLSSFLGGEGLVCKFSGKGRLWCQSHHAPSFGGALGPLLRPRNA